MVLEHLICIGHFARYRNIGPVLMGETEDREETNGYKCDEDHFQEVPRTTGWSKEGQT